MDNKLVDVKISIIKDLTKLAMGGETLSDEEEIKTWIDGIKRLAIMAKVKYIQYEKGKIHV